MDTGGIAPVQARPQRRDAPALEPVDWLPHDASVSDTDETFEDRGDAWSRLRRWLEDQGTKITTDVVGGTLTPEAYQNRCGALAQNKATLERMEVIRRGDDLRRRRSATR